MRRVFVCVSVSVRVCVCVCILCVSVSTCVLTCKSRVKMYRTYRVEHNKLVAIKLGCQLIALLCVAC
jgi:hypothetical protein